MAKIFNVLGRAGTARFVNPVARGLLRAGVTPDAVTIAGTVGVLVASFGFAARGHLFTATIIATLSAFTDLIDGTMARISKRTGRFGAFLDSTMDRVADGAIFGSIAYFLATAHRSASLVAALICLVAGQIVSYAKARAEGLGMTANVGIAERPERLVLIGVGGLSQGLGWGYGLDIVLWLLAVLSVITVAQRIAEVYRQGKAT